jgi:hypothetical protein
VPTPVEIFTNDGETTVSSGGTDAPAPLTTQSWTVASSATFPAASNSAVPATQFHIADVALPSEKILVTNVSGTTWSVTRGVEGTTPVAHATNFTIRQIVPASVLALVSRPLPTEVPLTDAVTIAVDASLGQVFTVTLGGNRTLGNPTNPSPGQGIIIRVSQDATGGRTLAYGTAYAFSTSLPSPTLSTAANATDYLAFIYSASVSKWRFLAFTSGF